MSYHYTGPLANSIHASLILRNFAMVTCIFNVNSTNQFVIDTTTPKGDQLDSLLQGQKQLITESTHILESFFNCIDLIFTNKPNIVMDSGIHSRLHSKCHHQTIYSKVNLKIEYSPPYTRVIWDYNRVENDSINRAIESFDQPKLFFGKNVHTSKLNFLTKRY